MSISAHHSQRLYNMFGHKPKIIVQFTWTGTDADLQAMCARASAACVGLWETELSSRGYTNVRVKPDNDIAKLNDKNGRGPNEVSFYPDIYVLSENQISDSDLDSGAQLQRELIGSAFKSESVPDEDIEKIRWLNSSDWQEDRPKEEASRR